MRLENLLVEVRGPSLSKVGALFPSQIELEATIRFNDVGAWTLRIPGTHDLATFLKQPGAGIIVSDTQSQTTLFSGPITSIKQTDDVDSSQPLDLEISGATDEIYLQDRLVWTDPTVDLSDAENSAENVYYARTGSAENLMHLAVRDNLGPTALAARKLPGLVMAPSGGRGSLLTKEVRYPTVLEFLSELATGESLGFRMRQSEMSIEFSTYEIRNRARAIRLAVHNRRLKSTSVQLEPPGITHAIVAATDDRAGYLQVDTEESVDAGAFWNRRIEKFINGNMKGAAAEQLEEVGLVELNESGFNNVATQAVAVDHEQTVYGVDWTLGDIVTVEIDNQELESQVTGFVLKTSSKDGVQMGIILGDATGFEITRRIVSRLESVDHRVAALERVPPPEPPDPTLFVPTGTVMPFAGATAPAGYLIANGAAVSRTTYSALYAVIGTAYGVGNGSTTFNLPNLRGRTPFGLDTGQVEFTPRGKIDGAKSVLLTAAQSGLREHSHLTLIRTFINTGTNTAAIQHTRGDGVAAGSNQANSEYNHAQWSNGSGAYDAEQAHQNMPPYVVMNFIIKT